MPNKKKILVLGDHPYTSSGVGTTIKYFIDSMLVTNKYSFICLGGAMKHADYTPIKPNDDLYIIPVDGYGTQQQVRDIVHNEKVDAIWLMTDPRYWTWLWQIEQELRPLVPILYYHVWDNYPYPYFNKPFYLSNDMVVTMSQVSSNIVKAVAPEVSEYYIPLTVDTNIFKPMNPLDFMKYKKPEKTIFFWNNRNARRKMSGSILWWFKEFLDVVGHDNAMLHMHTDPFDPHGPNLIGMATSLGLTREQFLITNQRVTQEQLCLFYNVADCVLNVSDAEGVGMGTIESLACGTPIIVNMTGGLQEQVTDGTNWFGIGIEPVSKAIVGSQECHYIYEDRVSKEDFIAALIKMYNTPATERKKMGLAGRDFVLKKYDLSKFASDWEKVLDNFLEKNGSWETRKEYNNWIVKEF